MPPHRFVNQWNCFSQPLKILPPNGTLNLKHLVSAAKDPIKFHFNRTLEIYLENADDRQVKTEEELIVAGLDYYHLKQEAIKEPIESVLAKAEKEGKLPFGVFKEVAQLRLKKEIDDFHQALEKHSLKPSDIFEIEFSADCSSPIQINDERWLFPPVVLSYDEGVHFSIIGKLPLVTRKGLLALSKDALPDIWKTWPQFLLYCSAAKCRPDLFEPHLIPLLAAKSKAAFFHDPDPYLKKFVHYFALCLENISPLMPDWLPLFLQEDTEGLKEKIIKAISETSRNYQSPYLHWIFNKNQLPDSPSMMDGWKEQAESLTVDIINSWFKDKVKAGAAE